MSLGCNQAHQLKIVNVPEKNARRNRLHFQLIHTQGGSKHLISKYFVFVRRRKVDFCCFIYPFLAILQSFQRFQWSRNGFRIIFVAKYYSESNSNEFRFLNFANRPTRIRDTKNVFSMWRNMAEGMTVFCILASSWPISRI